MPGNHGHGGFATHVRVPANGLCPVPDQLPGDLTLDKLSVIADAVTTPLEAIHRARLVAGDIAIFVGVGGVGGFGVQVASAMGSRVVAIDIDQGRLDLAARHGASLILNSTTMELKQIKKTLRSFAEQSEDPSRGLKIFETSGSPAGQQLAYGLIGPGAHLAVVGYTAEPIELHLSNLMAFDATAQGNWGSHPARYPEALQFVLDERIALQPYVQTFPLDQAPEVIAAVAHHEIEQRAILVPTQE